MLYIQCLVSGSEIKRDLLPDKEGGRINYRWSHTISMKLFHRNVIDVLPR
jgi:hypothetical protein